MYKHPDQLTQTVEDWSVHLPGTFLLFQPKEGPQQYVLCQDVSSDGIGQLPMSALSISYSVEGGSRARRASGKRFSCVFPEMGMSDMSNNTLEYIYYRSHRQFRKSVSERVLGVLCINREYANALMRYQGEGRVAPERMRPSISLSALNQILYRKYVGIEEALASLHSGEASGRALSRNFGVILDYQYEHPVIVYRNLVIGYVVDGSIYFTPSYAPMVEEFEETTGMEVVIDGL